MKKIFSGILILMMFALVLASCTKKEETAVGTATVGKETATTKETAKAEEVNKVPEEFSVMTWENDHAAIPLTGEQPAIEYAMKATNTKINWQIQSLDGMGDKLTLAFASGEKMPEVIAGLPKNTTDKELADKDLIIPISDLIEQGKMPLTKALLEKPEMAAYKEALTNSDGKIYGLSTSNANNTQIWHFMIRKDWMNKLGVTMNPETMDELTDVLRKFRDGDPNGNGKADEVPWTNFMGGTGWIPMWYPNFGINTQDYFPWTNVNFAVQDGKFYYAKTDPKYKAMLEWLHMAYTEKLIDQEIFTLDSPKFDAKTPIMGSFNHWLSFNTIYAGLVQKDTNNPDAGYNSIVWPLANGVTERVHPLAGPGWWMVYVTKNSKNSDAAVKYLDYTFGNPDFSRIAEIGVEGVNHEVVDGKIKFLGKWADMDKSTREESLGFFNGRLPIVRSYIMQNQDIAEAPEYGDVRNFLEVAKPYLKPSPSYHLSQSETDTVNAVGKAIDTYTDEMVTGFITGKIPLTKWDEYVKKINDTAGDLIQKAIEVQNAYYDANIK